MSSPKPSVLIVDDDDDIRDAIGTILKLKGFEVVGARDGRQALELLRGGTPVFLILLDLMMPGMSGDEFKAALERDPAIAHVPLFVISGDCAIASRAAEMGATGFVRKPIELAELIELVGSYRDRRENEPSLPTK